MTSQKDSGIGESSLYNHFKSKTEFWIICLVLHAEIPFPRPTTPNERTLDTMSPEELLMQILLSLSENSGLLAIRR